VARELGADRRPLQTPAIAPVAAGMAEVLPVTSARPTCAAASRAA
jgi:hypothetical protein